MKKKYILTLLFCMLAKTLSADSSPMLYAGVYLGGGLPALDYIEEKTFLDIFTVGGDLLAGYEFQLINNISLGAYANTGLDTGLPNQPNFYNGILGELLWGNKKFKFGAALGGGYNASIDLSKNKLDSLYFRFAIPVVFLGIIKTSVSYDLYPDIGSRIGLLLHYRQAVNIGF